MIHSCKRSVESWKIIRSICRIMKFRLIRKEPCQQQITLILRAKVTHQAIRSMLIAKTIAIIAKI
nr:MAG TPA: hypothetical protein [Bacteriophage sp.]